MKNLFIIFAISFIFLFPQNVLAQKSTATDARNATKAAVSSAKEDLKIKSTKDKAIRLIENRVATLNKLLSRVSDDKNLQDTDKIGIIGDIQNAIKGLNDLKAKIDADSSAADVKADAQKILTDYKIYTVFEPKIRILVSINNLIGFSKKVADLTPRIQNLIDILKAQEQDVASLQASLDDINAQLKSIDTLLTDDKAKIATISVASTDAKQTFVAVRKDLATVRASFAKIRSDIAKMRNAFKINIKKSIVTPRPTSQ